MLYIVPTPIGNLDDITLRAINVLKEVDLLLAEDTRHTSRLLKHLGVEVKMMSFHQHNEHKVLDRIVDQILSGIEVALVSDAGTPGISDPGFLLVRACIEKDIKVSCLPGASAFVPALVQSGLPCDKFVFEGFLPQKKGRSTRLKILSDENRTLVFYESPHRLIKTLTEFIEHFGADRVMSISREISKIHEEVLHGTVEELLNELSKRESIKGELVLIVGAPKK